MKNINRVILIVLDSAGIGEMPDSDKFGDKGADTFGHIDKYAKKLHLPNLEELGLGNIRDFEKISKKNDINAAFGKMKEASNGKDTIIGHWEIAGIITKNPLPVYPNGFPNDVLEKFKKEAKVDGILGNYASSGTVILDELGEEHIKTKYPIVYTSADSVFQIAASEEVIPLKELYRMCEAARKVLVNEHGVGRVIARPFVGKKKGEFKRTTNRKDYPLVPPETTMHDVLKENMIPVNAVGKIYDIFAGKNIDEHVHIDSNMDGVDRTIEYMKQFSEGLIFTNLVDFDMVYGHRRDVDGYAKALMDFDSRLPEIFENMQDSDLLIITADHGCDPHFKGTDHTREYVPILVFSHLMEKKVDLKVLDSFSDIAKTIVDIFDLGDKLKNGKSFYDKLNIN
jgi:phosphopentomutase